MRKAIFCTEGCINFARKEVTREEALFFAVPYHIEKESISPYTDKHQLCANYIERKFQVKGKPHNYIKALLFLQIYGNTCKQLHIIQRIIAKEDTLISNRATKIALVFAQIITSYHTNVGLLKQGKFLAKISYLKKLR